MEIEEEKELKDENQGNKKESMDITEELNVNDIAVIAEEEHISSIKEE